MLRMCLYMNYIASIWYTWAVRCHSDFCFAVWPRIFINIHFTSNILSAWASYQLWCFVILPGAMFCMPAPSICSGLEALSSSCCLSIVGPLTLFHVIWYLFTLWTDLSETWWENSPSEWALLMLQVCGVGGQRSRSLLIIRKLIKHPSLFGRCQCSAVFSVSPTFAPYWRFTCRKNEV